MPRGGKRPGAGAPRSNLNALKHGRRAKLDLVDAAIRLNMPRSPRQPHRRRRRRPSPLP